MSGSRLQPHLKTKIRVVPICVDGTPLPNSSDLPEDLRPLVRRNAFELRNARFKRDAEDLVRELEKIGQSSRRSPTWWASNSVVFKWFPSKIKRRAFAW